MFLLPISSANLKRDFLEGSGELAVEASAGGFDPLLPFEKSDSAPLNVSGRASADLKFGSKDGLTCAVSFKAGARNGIELTWPGQPSAFTRRQGIGDIPEGSVGARLFLEASASAGVKGKMPVGPAGFSFGLQAGGSVAYDRFAVFPAGMASGRLLGELAGGLQLPQSSGTPETFPAAGEVFVLRYSGFLELNAALAWGYELSGTKGFEFAEIDAVIEYALRLKAGVQVGYRIGGEFDISARSGAKPGWVRLTVKKSEESKFDFAASFALEGEYELKGLPETVDEVLLAFLGADARHAIGLFRKVQSLSTLDALERESGKLLKGAVSSLARKWLTVPLSSANATQFFAIVKRVVEEIDSFDDRIVNAVTNLYEDAMGRDEVQLVRAALEKIAALRSREGLRLLSDNRAWQIIERLTGDNLFHVLGDEKEFQRVVSVAERAVQFIDGTWLKNFKDIIDGLKSELPLKELFGELKNFTSRDKLLALADEKLQGLVEKLLGRAWEEIRSSDVGKAAKELEAVLSKMDEFEKKFEKKLAEAAHQSIEMQLSFAFNRTARSRSLLDVDIDVTSPEGRALFEDASQGRLRAVFARASLPFVVVHEGAMTHEVSKSARLAISVFGWERKRLVEVVTRTEHSLEALPTGMVQVFTTQAAFKIREETRGRDKMAEILESNFLMRLTGETFRPVSDQNAQTLQQKQFLVKTIQKMAVDYAFLQQDDATRPEELTAYLQLAEHLRLIPSAAAMTKELALQFPNGFGKITVRYLVSYHGERIADAFTLQSGEPLKNLVRDTARQVTRSQFSRHQDKAVVGFAYSDPVFAELYYRKGFTAVIAEGKSVALPAWFAAGGGQRVNVPEPQRHVVVTLFNKEKRLADKLARLDEVIDRARDASRAVSDQDLEEAAGEFVEAAAGFESFVRVNSAFAVFDKFVEQGSGGKGFRQSSMILQILPPGSTVPVTKHLSS